jgi:hypothetical protein
MKMMSTMLMHLNLVKIGKDAGTGVQWVGGWVDESDWYMK